jgi:recombinational DNA repair protein RecT
MSTELQTTKPQATGLRAWVERPGVPEQIEAALGGVMATDTFTQHMMIAFQDPDVARCSDKSKYTALHQCAAMGLLPTLDQVKLIPYKNEVKAMPQWQGFKALMERNPDILEVTGHLVHVTDHFEMHNGVPTHTFNPFDEARTIAGPKDIVGGYCKIVYRDGRPPKYHFVTRKHIEKAQKCAQTQKIWSAWYEQMALKTLYRDCYARRAVAFDPMVADRVQQAIDLDNLNMGNDPRRVEPDAIDSLRKQARLAHQQQEAPEDAPEPPAPEEDPEPTEQPGDAEASQEEPEAGGTEWVYAHLDLGKFLDDIPPGWRHQLRECDDPAKVEYLKAAAGRDKRLTDKAVKAIVGACDRILAAEMGG